jgi:pyruvate formate lyase activating enzyme
VRGPDVFKVRGAAAAIKTKRRRSMLNYGCPKPELELGTMAECKLCGRKSPLIAGALGVCRECIMARPGEARAYAEEAHRRARAPYALPSLPPEKGIPCPRCGNACRIASGERGYCGMVENRAGHLRVLATAKRGYLSWYYDALPTNCVASWVCPAETGVGYPEYSNCEGPEFGYKNLAVFYHSCTYDCLFCQNSHFRTQYLSGATSAAELAAAVDERTACICYFGGDPTSQLEHSLVASRLALREAKKTGRILRICWETNGSISTRAARLIMEIALESGGCVKVDAKAADENVHVALTGASNRQTWENLALLARYIPRRPSPPPLVVSTLLVPGYVDEEEVIEIANRLVALNDDIPYSLLAFHPCHHMRDVPATSRAHAERCFEAARAAGLKRVRVANIHLLTPGDYNG